MKKIPENFINLTVTSPPYDNLRSYLGYSFDFEQIARQLYEVTKPGGVLVWVVGDQIIDGSESGTSFKQALYFKDIGFNLHDTMIYHKSGFAFPSSNRYHQGFEYMFIFSKGKPSTFNPIKDEIKRWKGSWGKRRERTKEGELVDRDYKDNGNIYKMRDNIWKYVVGAGFGQKDKIAYKHPATFPEKLAADHIISWSNEGDIVYDPFSGSGTTIKQCILLNRNWIGSEISGEYCEIIQKRIENLLKQPELF